MASVLRNEQTKVPVKTWLPPGEIESGAKEQLINVANHPEIGSHIAVMPDCHVGYGVPIGCVAPTVDAVIPNAVGVDIGCGLHAIQTGIRYDEQRMDQRFWRDWSGNAAREIPTGFASHKTQQKLGALDRKLRAPGLQKLLRDKAAFQLGTLGGGNHFLEAQVDENGELWLMVHSGSRNTGLRIANHTPVGFTAVRVNVAIDADAPADRLERLVQRAEQYCVVSATLKNPPAVMMITRVNETSAGAYRHPE